MKFDFQLSSIRLPQLRGVTQGRTAFLHWDRQVVSYLVASGDAKSIRVAAFGKLDRRDEQHPIAQVAAAAREAKAPFNQLVVLLSRADLEMLTLVLPPAEETELPNLVRSLTEEQLGESEREPRVDFLPAAQLTADGQEVFAFALAVEDLERLEGEAKKADAKLVAVAPRSLASLGLLRDRPALHSRTAIAVTIFDQEIELIVLKQGKPQALRTIRTQAEDSEVLAGQLIVEIQRCLALAGIRGDLEDLHLILFGDREPFEDLIDRLVGQFGGPVSLMSPLDRLQLPESAESEGRHAFAALAGAAKDHLGGQLAVNLMRPRRSPAPPNPYRRAAVLGGLAVSAVGVVAYVLAGDISALQTEYDQRRTETDQEVKVANKLVENAQKVRVAQQWLADEINWLEELKVLSEQLPAGDKVTIRRLTASSTPSGAVIDLSVQVSEPNQVAELESRLRAYATSVSSKRVSEQTADEDYPWQFETRIVLPRRSFANESTTEDEAAEAAATGEEGAAPSEGEPDTDNASEEASPESAAETSDAKAGDAS